MPAGVATGMAWTEMGGEILFIEATLPSGQQRLDAYWSTRRCDEGIEHRRREAIFGPTHLNSDWTPK
jgi:hypothetical protein